MAEVADTTRPLKLRACDGEDLRAIAAVVQDALVPVHDMGWLVTEARFVLAMNRFRWEYDPHDTGVHERTNCGLCFDGVARVQLRGFAQRERGFILDLLTVTYEAPYVILSFAGFRDVRLTVESLECRLDDFGEPWPTRSKPSPQGQRGRRQRMGGLDRMTKGRAIAAMLAVIVVVVFLVTRHADRENDSFAYDGPPPDTTPIVGTITQKWHDCWKSCHYHFLLQTADGTTTEYQPASGTYDKLAVQQRVRVLFAVNPVGIAAFSGVEVLEQPPPEAQPTPPPQETPLEPQPIPTVAAHKAKSHAVGQKN